MKNLSYGDLIKVKKMDLDQIIHSLINETAMALLNDSVDKRRFEEDEISLIKENDKTLVFKDNYDISIYHNNFIKVLTFSRKFGISFNERDVWASLFSYPYNLICEVIALSALLTGVMTFDGKVLYSLMSICDMNSDVNNSAVLRSSFVIKERLKGEVDDTLLTELVIPSFIRLYRESKTEYHRVELLPFVQWFGIEFNDQDKLDILDILSLAEDHKNTYALSFRNFIMNEFDQYQTEADFDDLIGIEQVISFMGEVMTNGTHYNKVAKVLCPSIFLTP